MEHREQSGFKFVVGFMVNSVAIMINALNDASDVLGYPAGQHGRVEDFTA